MHDNELHLMSSIGGGGGGIKGRQHLKNRELEASK